MHELSIASNLLDQVLAVAGQHGMTRVTEIEVRCGVARLVVPDALHAAFAALAAGTLASDATLRLVEEPLRIRCRACQLESPATVEDCRCSKCGQADVAMVAGHEIILQSVVGDQPEDTAT